LGASIKESLDHALSDGAIIFGDLNRQTSRWLTLEYRFVSVPLRSVFRRLISRNRAAAARCSRARAAGGSSRRSAGAILPECGARALHVDFARHLDRGVVAVLTPAQGSPERIGLLLGARPPEPAGLAVWAGAQHTLLLHRLGEVLRAAAQNFERAALGIDRAVRVAFSKLTFRLAHGALLAQLLHQLLELIAQRLLILAELAHLIALLALLALLAALAVAPLVLALLERAIAQLLLLADHVAELVERRHHVVVATGIMERELKRVKNARLFLIPGSENTAGHLTTSLAKFWKQPLEELLSESPRAK
jgi:hypothetical protein